MSQGHEKKGHEKKESSIGLVDVLVAAVLFYLLTLGLDALLAAVVPGLLKPDTLTQIQFSGVLFFLFWGLVGNRFFKPHIDVVIAREAMTLGAEESTKRTLQEAKLLDEQVSRALAAERLELLAVRDRVLAEARQEVASRIERAELDISKLRDETKLKIASLRKSAESEVESEAEQLAGLVLERALTSPERESLVN